MHFQNNKFLVSACVFSLVSNLGSNISFAMKENDDDNDKGYSLESSEENDPNETKKEGKENRVDNSENKMRDDLKKYNNNDLCGIFEENQNGKKLSNNNIEDEDNQKEEMKEFLGLSGVPSFNLGDTNYKTSSDIAKKRNSFESNTVKTVKKYEEDKEDNSKLHDSITKINIKLSSPKTFFEDSSQKNDEKFQKYNESENVNEYVTPKNAKGNDCAYVSSNTIVNNVTYSRDKNRSPEIGDEIFNENNITPCKINEKNSAIDAVDYRINRFNTCLNKITISSERENFYDHLREIFAEHPQYKVAVPVIVVGVIVFKEAFDL